jgi:hypothetical protein
MLVRPAGPYVFTIYQQAIKIIERTVLMNNYWISWYGTGAGFELHSPWWITGYRLSDDEDDGATICAAIKANSEDEAKQKIIDAHDKPVSIEWRFIEERPKNWSPFATRFLRSPWMQWN